LWSFRVAFAAVLVIHTRAAQVSIDPDGMVRVNDTRRFVLGLYEYPVDDIALKAVANAGFNLVQSGETVDAMDRLHQAGLFAWINTGGRIALDSANPGRAEALKKLAVEFGEHPALLVWEAPDEALWNVWYGAEQWRRHHEVQRQRALIATLADAELAEQVRAKREQADALFARAEFVEGERLADEIWRELGQEPPHPELNLSNAAERAAQLADQMRAGYALLREIDPDHLVWMNHAPRNTNEQRSIFNRAADVVGCDIYPIPEYVGGHSDLGDRSRASVGAYTRSMQAAAPGKPVWMVLQGFGWDELAESTVNPVQPRHPPTFEESRFMAYDAIVNGARGLLYWGTAYTNKSKSFYSDLFRLVRELADLQPVLSAPDAPVPVRISLDETWGSLDRSVRVLPKEALDGVWFVAVNEWSDPLVCTLNNLEMLEGRSYSDPAAGIEATVQNGRLRVPMRAYDVLVLRPI
jgi:hypothetical protein